ncbi:MAG: 4-(cytidine 5'-diphospho)-2-C-methyl-D-erythritol kinase [Rhodospirillaceae bacterium]|nr:4-(cytidine 5'-diphospho)-2-C-methyl-D-erythritol kinase [Rhodospirillaceae bacterium]
MAASAARTEAIVATAPAKINFSLHICGRRADGYHLLDSLVVFAGIGDRITVSPADELRLTIEGPFAGALAAQPDNLALRAARLLADTSSGAPAKSRYLFDARLTGAPGAHIVLEKNLPVASGIGGGSADAAATLVACGRLWNIDPMRLADREIAAKLGADVPVCLRGVPAFMSGIGETITPAPRLPQVSLVLVNPGGPLATKAVFAALRGRMSKAPPRDSVAGLTDAAALAAALAHFRNDLTAPALELLPAIGSVLAALEQTPGCLLARLSGSGPTCFGLFADEAAAGRAAAALTANKPGWWIAAAPVLAPRQAGV